MSKPISAVPATEPISIRTIKVGTCSSLSGQSQLTYQIGCTAESDILFRITGNTGAGIFSNEPIALSAIQQVFDAIPPGKLIRSALLQPLYQSRNSNTPAFLLAALVSEGLASATENQGYYLRTDPGKFMAEVQSVLSNPVDTPAETPPKKARKSA